MKYEPHLYISISFIIKYYYVLSLLYSISRTLLSLLNTQLIYTKSRVVQGIGHPPQDGGVCLNFDIIKFTISIKKICKFNNLKSSEQYIYLLNVKVIYLKYEIISKNKFIKYQYIETCNLRNSNLDLNSSIMPQLIYQ